MLLDGRDACCPNLPARHNPCRRRQRTPFHRAFGRSVPWRSCWSAPARLPRIPIHARPAPPPKSNSTTCSCNSPAGAPSISVASARATSCFPATIARNSMSTRLGWAGWKSACARPARTVRYCLALTSRCWHGLAPISASSRRKRLHACARPRPACRCLSSSQAPPPALTAANNGSMSACRRPRCRGRHEAMWIRATGATA